MRKKEAIRDPGSCLNKAADDEPIFVLRGQDVTAPPFVRAWAEVARANGVSDEKVQEAIDCAQAMEMWRPRRMPT